MALKLKITRPAFSLVESVIVLSIVSTLALFVLLLPKNSERLDQRFWQQYDAYYQNSRSQALTLHKRQEIIFKDTVINFETKTLHLPRNWVVEPSKINIHENGYIAPQTIKFKHEQEVVKLIYSFGGGQYRIE